MVPALGAVHRSREKRRSVRSARVAGPAAVWCALEELDSIPSPTRSRHSRHTIWLFRSACRTTRPASAELHNGHAERRRTREPLEQLRRLDGLDDDGGREALCRPGAPAKSHPDVREREDHARSALDAGSDVFEPFDVQLERSPRFVRQTEELEPVPAVGPERLGDRFAEREPLQRSSGRALEIALDLSASARHRECEGLSDDSRRGLGHRTGHHASDLGAAPVREIRRARAERVRHRNVQGRVRRREERVCDCRQRHRSPKRRVAPASSASSGALRRWRRRPMRVMRVVHVGSARSERFGDA